MRKEITIESENIINTPQYGGSRSGTQSIERVVDVLRVIASRGRRGMRVGEVVATSGLAEATCFRMLRRLELEGMVDRDPHTKKYFLGPLLYEFGLLARPRYRLAQLCDASLHRLAEFTQDTVYLSERSGLEAVCANRALGDFPIKSISLDIGIRRPLGVGAGGLAILCSLPPAEAQAIVEANAHRYEKFALFTADFLYGAIAEGRAQGYCFLDGVVTPGTASMGVAFPPHNPVAAISVAAISGRLQPERREAIAQQMHREVRKIV
jgi:DNA-binding IclR family transcriptional regulator